MRRHAGLDEPRDQGRVPRGREDLRLIGVLLRSKPGTRCMKDEGIGEHELARLFGRPGQAVLKQGSVE